MVAVISFRRACANSRIRPTTDLDARRPQRKLSTAAKSNPNVARLLLAAGWWPVVEKLGWRACARFKGGAAGL